jgi:hypothetical protein
VARHPAEPRVLLLIPIEGRDKHCGEDENNDVHDSNGQVDEHNILGVGKRVEKPTSIATAGKVVAALRATVRQPMAHSIPLAVSSRLLAILHRSVDIPTFRP